MSEYKSNENWEPFYGDGQEAKPQNAPNPVGKEITLRMFVDSDRAGDNSDRLYRTVFVIFMNMAMINWHTKKQATVEGTVFGAQCVSMKQGVEALRGIIFKFLFPGHAKVGASSKCTAHHVLFKYEAQLQVGA